MVFDEEDAAPVIVTVLDAIVAPLAGDVTDTTGGEDAKAFYYMINRKSFQQRLQSEKRTERKIKSISTLLV